MWPVVLLVFGLYLWRAYVQQRERTNVERAKERRAFLMLERSETIRGHKRLLQRRKLFRSIIVSGANSELSTTGVRQRGESLGIHGGMTT